MRLNTERATHQYTSILSIGRAKGMLTGRTRAAVTGTFRRLVFNASSRTGALASRTGTARTARTLNGVLGVGLLTVAVERTLLAARARSLLGWFESKESQVSLGSLPVGLKRGCFVGNLKKNEKR